jgi:hypothetical protein
MAEISPTPDRDHHEEWLTILGLGPEPDVKLPLVCSTIAVGPPVGIGGRVIRFSRFGWYVPSASPEPVATTGPRGGWGGGTLGCGFGVG